MKTAFRGCFLLLTRMVTQQALQEFKEIYKEEFNIKLSDRVAIDKAERFLALMKAIYRPISKNSPYLKKGGVYAPKPSIKPESQS